MAEKPAVVLRSLGRRRRAWTGGGRVTGCLALVLAALLLLVPAPATAASDPPPRHTVEAGDTLTAIAARYGSTVPAILAANLIADPDLIAVGEVLVVPPAAAPVLRIEVEPDDTLGTIARRYGTSPAELQRLNGMTPRQRLWVGQDLLVPTPTDQPSPALPPGPIHHIELSPIVVAQGETAAIFVQAGAPVSLTVTLEGQSVPLRPLRDGGLWGLAAVHALTEPGMAWLELRWADGRDSGVALWPVPVVDGDYPTQDIVLPPGKGELLAPDLVQSEAERLAAIWALPEGEPAWQGRFLRPVPEAYITSAPFGQRRSYNSGPVSGFHTGQDFAAPEGVEVIAPAAGQVVLAEPLTVRGNAVIIDHGAGVYTGYWHLSQISVSAGDVVRSGDPIGLVGTTGLSTGAHLHWELRLHGIAVSPLQWTTQAFLPLPVVSQP